MKTVDILWNTRAVHAIAPDFKDGHIPAHVVQECKKELQHEIDRQGITLEMALQDAQQKAKKGL